MPKPTKEYQREWRRNNPEKARAHTKAYCDKNGDKVREWERKSKHRKFSVTRPNPGRCEACGNAAVGKKHRGVLCLDHDHSTSEFRG